MIQATIGDVEKRLGVEYATASAVVKLMVAAGKGKEIGKRPTATGKGKPATIYELPETFEISLNPTVEQVPNITLEPATAPLAEVA